MRINLSECTNILDSQRIPLSSNERELLNKIYPYYGAQGIIDYVDRYIFDGQFILVAEDGNNLKSLTEPIATWAEGKFWVNNHAHILGEKDGYCLKYIYYVLNSLDLRGYITGSAQPKFNQQNLAKVTMDLPDYDTQCRIAKTLSTIDDKISNNNRINAELESMAKTIYDYWFTQFDFPDENGKPYKSSGGKMVWNEELKREIPEGWEVKQIKDVCCFENGDRGKNYPSGEDFKLNGIPFITGGAINENSIDYTNIRYIDNTKYDSLRAGKASYNDILLTLRGSLAKCVFSPFDKAAIASALVIVRPNSIINNTYLYHLLTSTGFIQTCNNYNNGSVQANLSVEAISSFFVIVPSKNILEKYESLICKFDEAIMKHKKENIELASLRDWLLPMLMNGQVGFEGVE